jgi:ABC-type transport system involved in multi-copper enzyme maturation permease subunit
MTSKSTPRFHKLRITHYASRLFFLNPIIIKEMRGHMRGPRAFWILTGYLLGLGLLAFGLYRISVANVSGSFGPGNLPQSAYLGQTLFAGLAFLELIFICLITPALTAGAISGERERRTFDMLLSTPLRPVSILWGKMFASLTYVQLLILAAVPLFSVVFLFGGVALRDVVQAIGLMALTAITYGTLGLFFSALTRRTGRATVLSYLIVFALIFGSFFGWMVTSTMGSNNLPHSMLYLNPVTALASAIVTPEMAGGMYGMGPAVTALFLVGGGPEAMGISGANASARPLWQYTVALYLAVTVVLYLLTTQLVKPVRRWRIGWLGSLVVVLIAVLIFGGALFVFGTDLGSTGWQGHTSPMPFGPGPVPVERVAVEVVEIPPTVVPPPEPTPTPASFDTAQFETEIKDYLENNILPEVEHIFCEFAILETQSGFDYANVFLWSYCRAFSVREGELAAGVGISAPTYVNFYWAPDQGWQITGHHLSHTLQQSPYPLGAQSLIEAPFDEAAGEQQLRERARQVLLGE